MIRFTDYNVNLQSYELMYTSDIIISVALQS
jgi:hypothetical protein